MIWQLRGEGWVFCRFRSTLAIGFSKIWSELENLALTIFKHALRVPETRGFRAIGIETKIIPELEYHQQNLKFPQFTKESYRGSQC